MLIEYIVTSGECLHFREREAVISSEGPEDSSSAYGHQIGLSWGYTLVQNLLNWEPSMQGPKAIHSMKMSAKAPPRLCKA